MAHTFTDDNFDAEVLKAEEVVLVDFWAPWCGPCKLMGPVIDELAEEYKEKNVKIGKVNVDENQRVPGMFGIMSIPTLIFFKGGSPVGSLTGAVPKQKLSAKLDELLG